MDEGTARDHIEDLMAEIAWLRKELNLARRAYDLQIFGESDIDENGVWRD